MEEKQLKEIVGKFQTTGKADSIVPLGNGLINDTFLVKTAEQDSPDYVLQRINHAIFTDVPLLQHNIETVTDHLRKKGAATLTFVQTEDGKTFMQNGDGTYWRMSVFIPDTQTISEVTTATSYDCGKSFAAFELMLVDLSEPLGEPIPDFHNMELRLRQLQEAVSSDAAGRVKEVCQVLEDLANYAEEMTKAERLHREGMLPKRICHCDTKVNNMLFDREGKVLCVIDLDTVMPSFVFSDYGDFLRTAASTQPEDSKDLDAIRFRMDIFEAFTRGYIEGARPFLTPLEVEMLPYAVSLFPYMQCVRFLTDYINGDTYYKIMYPTHNLVRALNQQRLFHETLNCQDEMRKIIQECYD
ncbi:MAG: aminoglycoside phosphotransferase family protein [Prevotella sp.]|nr:aminoglycoside phosphotransferase family protein [Prevotella sp.]